MEKKAFKNIAKNEKPKASKDSEGTLVLLEDEKKTNDIRHLNYSTEFSRLEERIKYLVSKPNLLDELHTEELQLKGRIKNIKKENKDMKRNS